VDAEVGYKPQVYLPKRSEAINRKTAKPQNRKTVKPKNCRTAEPQNRETEKPQNEKYKMFALSDTLSDALS
jgi:hypothetical protein